MYRNLLDVGRRDLPHWVVAVLDNLFLVYILSISGRCQLDGMNQSFMPSGHPNSLNRA